eukprot:TRINITY_DN3447_c0_g1_i1.p1 TRINITY_DN3447_c0_g1~~TRINITY_DN3447_c0_g1_i1.p1  ORF type:complete len:701 (-),score=137.96 TRINITY_DN3447_c0_g1_i1:125-2179(-)
MAGYGASLAFDKEAMDNLPIGTDNDSKIARRKLFRQADMNGNGITSLAECDRLIVSVLAIEGVKIMKPVINRAFHAARDIVPAVGSISDSYIDFNEFRYFLIYLKLYLELFLMYAGSDHKVSGKYSDRRLSFTEFEAAVPRLIEWGLEPGLAERLQNDPAEVFREIDDNGGGVVLFDEFAHWALWSHVWHADGMADADAGLAEAVAVLKKQKPNLCGKDLSSIKASKAKYRADAKISGQGCLGGDSSLKGGYDEIGDGGKILAAGGHYPGGLEAWKASFKRVKVAHADSKTAEVQTCANGCGVARFGRHPTCCTHCTGTDGPHAHGCVPQGYKECENGCGHPSFGKYSTCCTHCKGGDGPHHRSCMSKDAEKKQIKRMYQRTQQKRSDDDACGKSESCKNGCGRPRFRHYPTCCTRCQGSGGGHSHDCDNRAAEAGGDCETKEVLTKEMACCDAAAPRNIVRIGFEGEMAVDDGRGLADPKAPEDSKGPGTLRIRVRAGYFLRNRDSGFLGDVSDPFVRVTVGSEEKETPVIQNNLNPVWDSENEFSFSVGPRDEMMVLQVWNSNMLMPASSLGYTSVAFRTLGDGQWHECTNALIDGEEGKIEFALRFEPLFRIFNDSKDLPEGLSHDTFTSILVQIGMEPGEVDEVIANVDRDANGIIDVDEFLKWCWSEEVSDDSRDKLQR